MTSDLFWFIVAMALFLATLIAGGVAVSRLRKRKDAIPALAVVIGTLVVGGIIMFLDSFTMIPPRNEGIVNTLGKTEGSIGPGWHRVKPWSSIETVDATVQNINLNADMAKWNNEKICTAVQVRLANNTTACVDLTGQWNIDQVGGTASLLWQKYRGSDDHLIQNVGNNVVRRELQRAMNKAFEKYNPLEHLNDPAALKTGGVGALDTAALSALVLADLKSSVDTGVVVDKLIISLVHFDAVTQSKLDGFAQALADTQIATQQKLTAEQQAAANQILANTAATNDPGVQWQNCINFLKELAAKDQLKNLNAAFTCNSVGTGSPVIIGGR